MRTFQDRYTKYYHVALVWFNQRGSAFWITLLALIGALIYLPYLGSYPLWDPWEPHYVQVAWEMQQRDTWNNPWYRDVNNWWSKPILSLWLLRVSFSLFWNSSQYFAEHEWAARIPFALCAILGGVLHFDWVRRLWGKNVGVLAALILITAPQYILIGRQVMFDTTFVVFYSVAIGYLAVGLFAPRSTDLSSNVILHWLQCYWPFVIFWMGQALAVLAKGFIGPVLAIIIIGAYGIATFRWSDYRDLIQKRRWLHYGLTRGGLSLAVIGIALLAFYFCPYSSQEQRILFQGIVGVGVILLIALVLFQDFPLCKHALKLLKKMHSTWGLVLFLAVAAPWFIYMTVEHGWPYWKEFIFYHHLGRAAGTINKPGGTFEYFIRQLGYGLFPWSAFIGGATFFFFRYTDPGTNTDQRKNLFLFFSAIMPFLFFTLSGTKFAHYDFPSVPMICVMLALTIVWWTRSTNNPRAEQNSGSRGSGTAEAEDPSISHKSLLTPGRFLILVAISLIIFGIISHDLVLDYRHYLRTFIYYHGRETPYSYEPYIVLQIFYFPLGILIGLSLLLKRAYIWQVLLFVAITIGLSCYISWIMMPALEATYSFKPLYKTYQTLAKPHEAIGQYNNWHQPVRSVIFLFQNKAEHLKNNKKAQNFLKRSGRKFILVDRDRLADLRRAAKEIDKKIYIVSDDHPYARLVSDQPNPEDTRRIAQYVLNEYPTDMKSLEANFSNKIKLRGWRADTIRAKRGSSVELSFYYECLNTMSEDWQIFIHGDGPQGGRHRLHADHFPVEGLYLTTEWQEGEIIHDRFHIKIPADYPYAYFYVWNGWYSTHQRLDIEDSPPSDGYNRVRGPKILVEK